MSFTRIAKIQSLPAIFVLSSSGHTFQNIKKSDGLSQEQIVEKIKETLSCIPDTSEQSLGTTQPTVTETSTSTTTALTPGTTVSSQVDSPSSTLGQNHGAQPNFAARSIDPSHSGVAPEANISSPSSSTDTHRANRSRGNENDKALKKRTPSDEPKKPAKDEAREASVRRYKEALKKKKMEEIDERKRILRLLETDKKERAARAQRELLKNQLAQNVSEGSGSEGDFSEDTENGLSEVAKQQRSKSFSGRDSKFCALLIRNLDGSPLKYKFESTQKLLDVRNWVDQQLGNPSVAPEESNPDLPYNFVNPLTRVTYNASDEFNKTLAELDLTPSATLVIKQIRAAVSSAYGDSKQGSAAYGMVERGVKGIVGAVSTFLGIGYVPPRLLAKRKEEEEGRKKAADDQQNSYRHPNATSSSFENHGKHEDNKLFDTDFAPAPLTDKKGKTEEQHPVYPSAAPSGVSTRYSSVTSFHDLLNSTPGSGDYHGIGKTHSASTSSSNIRTIHDKNESSAGSISGDAADRKKKDDTRVTYNGNNVSLEDKPDNDDK